MITDHAQMGRLTTAYMLLANIPLRVTEKNGMIIIHSPHYNVDEQFTSEYNAIMWLHKEIASVVATDIAWLMQHEEAFNGTTCVPVQDKD
jgi:hypothetical protein